MAAARRGPTLILVEHESVYTVGRRTHSWERPASDNVEGVPVIDVDRGGKTTWHGPGQLTVYPIVRLARPIDVIKYVRALEAAVMEVCAAYGVGTRRVAGRSGVWVPADAADPTADAADTAADAANTTTDAADTTPDTDAANPRSRAAHRRPSHGYGARPAECMARREQRPASAHGRTACGRSIRRVGARLRRQDGVRQLSYGGALQRRAGRY